MRILFFIAAGLLLVACSANEATPESPLIPDPQAGTQVAAVPAVPAVPAVAPAPIPAKAPAQSPGAASAARQRAAFPAQEELRLAEANRVAEIRRQQAEERAAEQRREEILDEIARRAELNRAKVIAEQNSRAARKQIVSAACEQAQIASIAADYRGELPSRLTRRVLDACSSPSGADRWGQLVAILPDARAEWQALSEAETATWAEAERLEAEIRRIEEVRQRRAEIEAKIRADQLAIDQAPQIQSDDVGLLDRVASVAAALPAPLIQLVRQSVSQLDDLPAVLGQRAAALNQRARSGTLTALALADRMPPGVRAAGKEAMEEFARTRHVSHIESVRNNPGRAADAKNLIWEKSKWNLARGSKNISAAALIRANAHNAGATLQVAGPGILAQTAQGCVIGAVMELPVAAAEQRRPVLDGIRTTEEALLETAKSVAVTGLTGCALTAAAAGAASVGVVSLGAPILIPIAVAGGSIYVLTTSKRIWDSLSEEEQSAVMGQLDVSREVIGNLTGSTWAAAQDGGALVAATIQETRRRRRLVDSVR